MSYKIVVARFNENIEWLKRDLSNCVIYNKGKPLHLDNEISLKNVGRESETYLQYVIANYEHLPDVVVFTQARISDHKGKDDINYLLNIKNEALQYSKSRNYYRNGFERCATWGKEWNVSREGRYYLEDNYKNNTPLTFLKWFQTHIDANFPMPMYIYQNAIFAVRKEHILNKPVEYYKQLLLEVNHHINPAEGHFLERSWYYIFN